MKQPYDCPKIIVIALDEEIMQGTPTLSMIGGGGSSPGGGLAKPGKFADWEDEEDEEPVDNWELIIGNW